MNDKIIASLIVIWFVSFWIVAVGLCWWLLNHGETLDRHEQQLDTLTTRVDRIANEP